MLSLHAANIRMNLKHKAYTSLGLTTLLSILRLFSWLLSFSNLFRKVFTDYDYEWKVQLKAFFYFIIINICVVA